MEPEHVRVEEEDQEEEEQTVVIEIDVGSQNQGNHGNNGQSVIFEGREARQPFIPSGIAVIKTKQQKLQVQTRQTKYTENLRKRNLTRGSGPPPQ